MKKIKYFLFSLICMFCCSIVFAENEVVIKSITPIYDEGSYVIVSNENVTFNDKNQSVKYNVVIENTTDKDLTIEDITLSKPTEDFLIYELEGLKKDDVLKANSIKNVVVSLSTIKKEGWGRNFNDELTANISFNDSVLNPNTSTMGIVIILVIVTFFTMILITMARSKKISKYAVLVIMFGSIVSVTKAKESLVLPIMIKVSYESQNVMRVNTCIYDFDGSDIYHSCGGYWDYASHIKRFYVENELVNIETYKYKFDMSDKQDGKVMAYLVEDENDSNFYDLHLLADGIIYANSNAQYYFLNMRNLEYIDNLEGFDTSNVTNMYSMFDNTGADVDNFNLDLSSFDTSNVQNMMRMFRYTGKNSTDFTLDISNFDTSNVTNMTCMFCATGYSSKVLTLDINHFDTSNVTDMASLFEKAGFNSENLTLKINSLDTRKLTNISEMFYQTGYNATNFTIDLSDFDTINVVNMSKMFYQTGYNSKNFMVDLSVLDTSNVTDMSYMFYQTGYNNTDFVTSINISNPSTNVYNLMFRDVATKGNSKITVNYTSETSDLVDQMIATKSSNSNVVKGVQVD